MPVDVGKVMLGPGAFRNFKKIIIPAMTARPKITPANKPRRSRAFAPPKLRSQNYLPQFNPKKPMNENDTPTRPQSDAEPFGPVIYAYTRAQAVADGQQVEVTKTAQEAGIRFPVFLTRAVYDVYVTVPPGVTGQDETGRLWDLVWMLRFAIHRARPGVQRIPVAFYVRNDNRAARLVKLIATCGPLDMDDPQPAITIMQPGED